MTRLATSPAFHFVLIGALLYVSQGFWYPTAAPGAASAELHRIVVDRDRLEDLRDSFRKLSGRDPGAAEEQSLIRDYTDREILYREALRRGLDKADRSVKFRLVQKMQFLEDRAGDDPDLLYREALELGLDRGDLVIRRLLIEKMRLLIKLNAVSRAPEEAELLKFYKENAEDYRQPARVSLHHVFLSADKRGATLGQDAAALLAAIRAQSTPAEAAIALGDVFPLGHTLRSSSEQNLAKLFGPAFAREVIGLDAGAWYGPIRSAYGMHLVWIDSRQVSKLPGLEPVRNQITQRYLAELRDAKLTAEMEILRRLYAVTVARDDKEVKDDEAAISG